MQPLRDVKVVDLSRVLAGPFATMILGDMGADVVKVERPGRGDDARGWGPPFVDGTSTYFLSVNRGKRSLTLDLADAVGAGILWELLEDADVVVSNFRPGVMERLGFGFEAVAERCPRVVYAVVSGYGSKGERSGRPAYDFIIQAESGLMDITGPADGPPTKVGVAIADEVAGLYLVQGILLALLERGRTGRGQRVEVALHDAILSMLTYQAQAVLSGAGTPRRMGNAHPSIVPYRTFEASDGTLAIGVGNDEIWARLCGALGREDLLDRDHLSTNAGRVEHRREVVEELAPVLAAERVGYWEKVLTEAGVPCGAVATLEEALRSEVTVARGMVTSCPGGELETLGIPVRLSTTPGSIRRPPPRLGEHTDEILRELGHTSEEIESWRVAGVI